MGRLSREDGPVARHGGASWPRPRSTNSRAGAAKGLLAVVLVAMVASACGTPSATPLTVPSTTASTTTTVPTTTTTSPTTTTTVPTTTVTTTTVTTTLPTTSTTLPAKTTTTTSTTRPVTTTTASCPAAGDLASWSLQRLAEQTIVVPVDETDVSSVSSEVAAGAGGVILFGSTAPTDLAAALQSLDASAPGDIAPFMMTDEEGGVVQRMADLVGSLPSAREMGATMTATQIRQAADDLAVRMRAAGVTMDLAPVLDVDGGAGPNNQDPDGTRSFSDNEKVVATDALAFESGLAAGGIIPVVKHFPGLGGATGNTDVMSASTVPWRILQRVGLVPFEDAVAAQVPVVMVANASVPGLTELPASISENVITGVLRNQLGFHGLVITDSLSAISLSGIGYSVPAASVAALEAGVDMVLFNADAAATSSLTSQIVSALVAAVGTGKLARSQLVNAVTHILTLKHVQVCSAS